MNNSIPPEIGNMKSLNCLYHSNNSITSEIPSTICYLTQLSILNLDWNQISGSIPIEIANCHSLYTLFLSHNYLTQTIPSQIGGPCSIRWNDLSYNNLPGKILPLKKKKHMLTCHTILWRVKFRMFSKIIVMTHLSATKIYVVISKVPSLSFIFSKQEYIN